MRDVKPDTAEVLILFYLSIETPLGFYRGRNDEANQEAIDELSNRILNQELNVLRLIGSAGEVMFFGEQVVANSVIQINYVNKSLPF